MQRNSDLQEGRYIRKLSGVMSFLPG